MDSTNYKTTVSIEDMPSYINFLRKYMPWTMDYKKEQGMWPVNKYVLKWYIHLCYLAH